MTDADYPKIVLVECALCGETITIAIELQIGTPRTDGAMMRTPLDPYPTVLAGCEHFYRPEN